MIDNVSSNKTLKMKENAGIKIDNNGWKIFNLIKKMKAKINPH